jgi:hypothetical protein
VEVALAGQGEGHGRGLAQADLGRLHFGSQVHPAHGAGEARRGLGQLLDVHGHGGRAQVDLLRPRDRRRSEQAALDDPHQEIHLGGLDRVRTGAQGEQGLLEEDDAAVALALEVDHVGGELLRLRDVAHPEALEVGECARGDGAHVHQRIEIDGVEHLLADHGPQGADLGAQEGVGARRPPAPGWYPAVETAVERIVLGREAARVLHVQTGRLLLDLDLPGSERDQAALDPDAQVAHPRAAGRQGAQAPGDPVRARQGTVAEGHVVVLVRAAHDLEVVEVEVGPEAQAAEPAPLRLDRQGGGLVDADPLRLQRRLDPHLGGKDGQGGEQEKEGQEEACGPYPGSRTLRRGVQARSPGFQPGAERPNLRFEPLQGRRQGARERRDRPARLGLKPEATHLRLLRRRCHLSTSFGVGKVSAYGGRG